jgi:dCMP deaminase
MRKPWHEYFMEVAFAASTRATCPRKSVGCVIVRDNAILATGYNGSIIGAPHCSDIGCLMEHSHCIRTVHAEVNAVAQAAKHGVRIDKATAYVTASPCFNCFKTLVNAGITRIVYKEFYRDERIIQMAADIDGFSLVSCDSIK